MCIAVQLGGSAAGDYALCVLQCTHKEMQSGQQAQSGRQAAADMGWQAS